jgi:uncharacterized alkaline shock family protein YloU
MRQDTVKGSLGAVRISDEAVASIVSIAVVKVPKVIGLDGGVFDLIVDGVGGLFGKKIKEKGIKVNMNEKEVSVEIAVIVEFGCDTGEVGSHIQESVREAIESMTGLVVSEVNVNITSVK